MYLCFSFTLFLYSVNDDCTSRKTNSGSNKDSPSDVFTMQLNSLLRGVGGGSSVKDSLFSNNNKDSMGDGSDGGGPQQFDAKCYIDNGKINFGKLITDEVLAADHKLVEAAKKTVSTSKIVYRLIIYNNTIHMNNYYRPI